MIHTIVLDFGRVLGHFDHRRAAEAIAPHTSVSAEVLHRCMHEGDLAVQYEIGAISTEEYIAAIEQKVALKLAPELFHRHFGDIFWPNEPMLACLPALARRYPLILLSNTCDLHARRFLDQFRDSLRHFTHLILSHEVRSRKPTAGIYQKAEELAACPPEQLLFLDDLEVNVQAARVRGWQAEVYLGGDPKPILHTHGISLD